MFTAAVSAEDPLDDLRLGGFQQRTRESHERTAGGAFASHFDVDDRAAATIEIAEQMLETEVHFGEVFLHKLDLCGTHIGTDFAER